MIGQDAEGLLDMVAPLHGRNVVFVCSTGDPFDDAASLATVRLGLDLAKARPVLRLRAVVEGWDQQRVMRELY